MSDKIRSILVEIEAESGDKESMYLDRCIADLLNTDPRSPVEALLRLQEILVTASNLTARLSTTPEKQVYDTEVLQAALDAAPPGFRLSLADLMAPDEE